MSQPIVEIKAKEPREISYIEAQVSNFQEIKEFCEKYELKCDVEDMHCSLLYSVKQDGFAITDVGYPTKAIVVGTELFFNSKQEQKVLVLLLKSEMLERRYHELMKVPGATYDFPEFRPHVTVSYNSSQAEHDKIPVDTVWPAIEFGNEFLETFTEK